MKGGVYVMDPATCSLKLAMCMSLSEKPAHLWVLRMVWTLVHRLNHSGCWSSFSLCRPPSSGGQEPYWSLWNGTACRWHPAHLAPSTSWQVGLAAAGPPPQLLVCGLSQSWSGEGGGGMDTGICDSSGVEEYDLQFRTSKRYLPSKFL